MLALHRQKRKRKSPRSAKINVTAHGDRRGLEALYLELCKLARQNGLKVEYRLTRSKPDDE